MIIITYIITGNRDLLIKKKLNVFIPILYINEISF